MPLKNFPPPNLPPSLQSPVDITPPALILLTVIISKDLGESLQDYLSQVYPDIGFLERYKIERTYWVGCAMLLKMQRRALDLAGDDRVKLEIAINALTNEVQHGLQSVLDDINDPSLN